jgi:DNA-binding transcriptional MerR regulator
MRFRPMLVGEVAKIAGVPRETLRVWLRRETFAFPRPKAGWKRFSDFETIIIAVFAAMVRATQDHELAQIACALAGKTLMDEWNVDDTDVPYFSEDTFHRDRFLLFWRDIEGKWQANIFDAPEGAQAATNLRIQESYSIAPVFTVVNFGTILKQVLLAILEVQIEITSKLERGDK